MPQLPQRTIIQKQALNLCQKRRPQEELITAAAVYCDLVAGALKRANSARSTKESHWHLGILI